MGLQGTKWDYKGLNGNWDYKGLHGNREYKGLQGLKGTTWES